MKLIYGYYNEEKQNEIETTEEKPVIKERVIDLMQIYDWVTVLDNSGNDVTCEYC
jgi:hypothetical protein